VLDEYGVPPQLAARALPERAADLDDRLEQLRRLKPEAMNMSPFERELLESAQARL
jgi:hypothetical protein